jgi:hypothetical protein
VTGELEKRREEEEERLLSKGFRKPYFPYDAWPRRWDGNEILGQLSKRVRGGTRRVLRVRPLEFVSTLAVGPVIYCEPEVPSTPKAVEESITTDDPERLKELYEHSRELMEREEATRTSVEGRAKVLLGAGGLTTTLIIGVSGLLARGDLEKLLPPGATSRVLFVGLYLLGLFALVMSLLRAVQTAKVVAYQPFSATRPFEVQEYAPAPRFRHLIREAFLTYVDLRMLNSIKAGLLRAAQWWFVAALVLLLGMAAVPVLAPLAGWLCEALGQVFAQPKEK